MVASSAAVSPDERSFEPPFEQPAMGTSDTNAIVIKQMVFNTRLRVVSRRDRDGLWLTLYIAWARAASVRARAEV